MPDHLYSILRVASQLPELSVLCQLSVSLSELQTELVFMVSYSLTWDTDKQRWLTSCCTKPRLKAPRSDTERNKSTSRGRCTLRGNSCFHLNVSRISEESPTETFPARVGGGGTSSFPPPLPGPIKNKLSFLSQEEVIVASSRRPV